MNILNVLLFLAMASAATIVQVRKLLRDREVKTSIAYITLMSLAFLAFALVSLGPKVTVNPMSLLQFPFENIGKFLFKQN